MPDISESLNEAVNVATTSTQRNRWRDLIVRITSSPLLPILGWTKVVESVVAGGPFVNWIVYAVVITLIYVYGVELRRRGWHKVEELAATMESEPM